MIHTPHVRACIPLCICGLTFAYIPSQRLPRVRRQNRPDRSLLEHKMGFSVEMRELPVGVHHTTIAAAAVAVTASCCAAPILFHWRWRCQRAILLQRHLSLVPVLQLAAPDLGRFSCRTVASSCNQLYRYVHLI